MKIVERFESDGVKIARCLCACGLMTYARAEEVESGLVKSCGNERASSILPLLIERTRDAS